MHIFPYIRFLYGKVLATDANSPVKTTAHKKRAWMAKSCTFTKRAWVLIMLINVHLWTNADSNVICGTAQSNHRYYQRIQANTPEIWSHSNQSSIKLEIFQRFYLGMGVWGIFFSCLEQLFVKSFDFRPRNGRQQTKLHTKCKHKNIIIIKTQHFKTDTQRYAQICSLQVKKA